MGPVPKDYETREKEKTAFSFYSSYTNDTLEQY